MGALLRPKLLSGASKRFAVERLPAGGVAGNALRSRGVWSITADVGGVVFAGSSHSAGMSRLLYTAVIRSEVVGSIGSDIVSAGC